MAEKNEPDPNEPDPNEPDPNEPDPSEEEGEKPTYEELLAERDELQRRVDRARTAKAREKRAENRAKGGGGASTKADEPNPLQEELDAAKARAAELETKANKAQALSVAAELGFRNPQYGVRLLDWDEITDAGDVDEVRAAMRALLKADPTLKKSSARADGGEGGNQEPGARSSFNDVLRRAAGRS